MQVILMEKVGNLGNLGDVVKVKDGYARNYLIPRKLAVAWTKGGEKQVASIQKARSSREIKTSEEALAVKAQLEGKPIQLSAKAGASGRLFGAVTPADIAAAVSAAGGPVLDRRKIELAQPVKSLGSHALTVHLAPEVKATVTLEVVAG